MLVSIYNMHSDWLPNHFLQRQKQPEVAVSQCRSGFITGRNMYSSLFSCYLFIIHVLCLSFLLQTVCSANGFTMLQRLFHLTIQNDFPDPL